MSDLSHIVDSLENKISKLLHKYEVLKQANLKLTQDLAILEKTKTSQSMMILEWGEKYEALKLANSMLGSSETKTEAKLKINTLIREIDYCIAQLSN